MKACGECARACNETAEPLPRTARARNSGDRKIHARVHELTMDCQAFCALSTTMMERGSDLMQYSCEACADACRSCAEACDKHPASEMVKACAEKCRTCEAHLPRHGQEHAGPRAPNLAVPQDAKQAVLGDGTEPTGVDGVEPGFAPPDDEHVDRGVVA